MQMSVSHLEQFPAWSKQAVDVSRGQYPNCHHNHTWPARTPATPSPSSSWSPDLLLDVPCPWGAQACSLCTQILPVSGGLAAPHTGLQSLPDSLSPAFLFWGSKPTLGALVSSWCDPLCTRSFGFFIVFIFWNFFRKLLFCNIEIDFLFSLYK